MFTHSMKTSIPISRDQELKRIETRLSAFDNFPIQVEHMPEDVAALYNELNSIVETEEDDRARAFADMLLRLAFGDDKAVQRTKVRTGAVTKALQEASKRLEAAVKKAEWQPPIGIHETLKALTFGYGISEDDLAEFLGVIRFTLEENQGVDRNEG